MWGISYTVAVSIIPLMGITHLSFSVATVRSGHWEDLKMHERILIMNNRVF